jgi:hypothetical protein
MPMRSANSWRIRSATAVTAVAPSSTKSVIERKGRVPCGRPTMRAKSAATAAGSACGGISPVSRAPT